jgi:hypothetical protein
MIGNVVPGSCFAILQSAGMGGYGVEIAKKAAWFAAESAFSILHNVMKSGNFTCPI